MATIKDVARLAGVSVATVSRVINNSPKASEASRQSVGAAMETLNYHPNANARALAQQSTETVGLVVGDVSDPFFGAMVKAVEQVAYRTGNFLLIGNGYHNVQKERQAIEQLIRHRCAALVVHAKMIPDEELAGLMKQIPGMVLINRILPGYETRCVALDDRYGAWLATRHLIQQGHTRIGYLCSNHHISDAEDRLQGYYAALEESGLPCNDRLVAFAEPDESGGELAMTELLGRGRHFSAVACYNDSMAAGAMGVLNDNGIDVPREISLIGFDDVLISRYVRPRLTTVRYPIVTMATQAAELALALAEHRPARRSPTCSARRWCAVTRWSPRWKAISHSDRDARRWPGNPAPRRCSASRSVHRNPGRRSRDRAPESPRGGHNRSHAAAVFRPAPDRGDGRDVQRRQPGKQILAADQVAAPEANRAEQLLAFHGNKGQWQRLRRLAMLHNAGEKLPRQRLAAKGVPQPVGYLRGVLRRSVQRQDRHTSFP
ncbi:LacI family transcriptional repressor [Klebsiella variicola]|uniref:LacI family transcriptional repressor n=15 Tax=Gammaproteobacteria TaxID=1236 RepID=A0A7H4MRT4_KLEVA|nr:LacI family transcriptional repressor [Klebsiella variicola]